MKKKLFTLLLALVAIATTARAQVVLNETNFPDANFRAALATWLGIGEGDEITETKIAAMTRLVISTSQIADLTGIEHFIALKMLYCYNNQLTSLDVSKNTALTSLYCDGNQLTSLDVSKTALTELYCFNNQIKGEAMDALVNSLPTVEKGWFYVIDTKKENEGNVCTKSQVAVAKGKGWTVYNYNGGKPVKWVQGVLLNAENFPDANFRAALASILKISEGDEITEAKIAATTSLDVSRYGKPDNEKIADLTGIEHFTALTSLDCNYNNLTSLDVSKNTALKTLYCEVNQLTALDVSKNTALTVLDCRYNQLTALDVSKNTALTLLDCSNNQLTSLDVSKNTALTYLSCDNNQLTALDVSKNTALTVLRCVNNQLTSLDVSKNIALTRLDCSKNQLTALDVSKNTALTSLVCYSNQLAALDVSKNTALTFLDCEDNQLTSLDVSNNTALEYLYCDNNQLTSLDVSNNTALKGLECFSNQIKGEAMDALVASLPTVENGGFHVINTKDTNEGNVCTKAQVAIAKEKGWTVYDYDGGNYPYPEYEGSDDAAAKLLLNAENFPDANFRAALATKLGISEGDEITEEKIAATTTIDVSKSYYTPDAEKIADLTGIEHFTALTFLYCGYNQLTSLDVSKNTALTDLDCGYNQLTALDVSKNTALTFLACPANQLTSLDVSKNTKLGMLECSGNQLTALDVSNNTALTDLYCFNNQLTALDVSKNTALTVLYCDYNQLPSLDVSKNTALKGLDCSSNQLTSLDVSKNTALTVLYCFSNQIKGEAMDALVASLPTVKNGAFYVIDTKDENEGNVCTKSQVAIAKEKGWTVYDYNGGSSQEYEGSDDAAAKLLLNAENFPDANFRAALAKILGISEGDEITEEKIAAMTSLNVSSKNIADLTGIEHFSALKTLSCSYNPLTALEVSKNTALTNLYCESNQLTALDVSGCTTLTELLCHNNQLTTLDVSKNTALTKLQCGGNQLTSLDVLKNTALKTLYCNSNQLTALDVSKNTALTDLVCSANQLAKLNVSQNTALTRLECVANQLTSLDVSKNIALTRLSCGNNPLTSLDVSKNTALKGLDCSYNQLTSLDVSNNTALTNLGCAYNQLTALNVSKNTTLTELLCHNNQLTSLDVSNNTELIFLYCFSNQIKGEAMDALVASLPTVSQGYFYVINTKDENEGNVCTKVQVAVAKDKGWTIYNFNGRYPQEYEGSDPVEEDIDPVDEDDNIDFGSDMDENDDLDGNVIGDIYYNINTGNGGYNAAEGCIVVKKPTDDGTVNDLEGKDIFGEDFKSQFTGIVFKVPAGKGTIKVNAETTGNMLLKVKIGSNDPVEMELNGKLKVTFPYNVSETTYVYIYAGAANEAKGFGTTNDAEDAALKIYGIEFERGETTGVGASLNDNGQRTNDSWYTIDGKKLSGEPTKKGVYIYKGKKVKK